MVEKINNTAHRSESIQKAQAKVRELRENGWKPVYKNPVEQAKANPNSAKAAIKAFCWICVGADADPGAKFRVRDCAVGSKCPLFAHRPWQRSKGGIIVSDSGELIGNEDSENTAED